MLSPNSLPTKAKGMLTSGLFLMVFGSCLSIMLTVAYASLGTAPQERFITLSTTGSDLTTRTIYPTSSSFVREGETLDWRLQVANHMGETEYVAIRVKLLNETQFGPDNNRHLSSPASHIYEERMVLANNASLTSPLTITLKDIEMSDGGSSIKSLVINGIEIDGLDVSNEDSRSFRFVIELWRYDVQFENFVHTWASGPESESAWNQIRIQVN